MLSFFLVSKGCYLFALDDGGTDIDIQVPAQLLVSCKAAVAGDVGVGEMRGDGSHSGDVVFFGHDAGRTCDWIRMAETGFSCGWCGMWLGRKRELMERERVSVWT